MQKATEKGVTQRDCVISLGQREASVEAEEGRIRLTQRPEGLTQLAKGAGLSVSGLRKAKRLNPSVVGHMRLWVVCGAKLVGYCGQNST